MDGDSEPIGENPAVHAAKVWVLGFELVWALPFGVLGAGLGAIIDTDRNRPGAAASPPSLVGGPR